MKLPRAIISMLGIWVVLLSQGSATASQPQASKERGAELYKARCSVCHGVCLKGVASMFPSLIGVTGRLTETAIKQQVRNGKGRMLPFPDLSDEDLDSLVLFLKTQADDSGTKPTGSTLSWQRPGTTEMK
jgi:quinoprotein glucose dehydrogenase